MAQSQGPPPAPRQALASGRPHGAPNRSSGAALADARL